jgi:hypothetical protein
MLRRSANRSVGPLRYPHSDVLPAPQVDMPSSGNIVTPLGMLLESCGPGPT